MQAPPRVDVVADSEAKKSSFQRNWTAWWRIWAQQSIADFSDDFNAPEPVAPPPKLQPREPPKLLTKEDEDLWAVFEEFNVKHDGYIDGQELQAALAKLGLPSTPEWVVVHTARRP